MATIYKVYAMVLAERLRRKMEKKVVPSNQLGVPEEVRSNGQHLRFKLYN